MRLKRTVPVLAASVAAVAMLSGCGVAPTQFHPGVAAQVGDQTITDKHVDALTSDYCAYAAKSAGSDATAVPLRYLSHQVAAALVLRAASKELADEDGVAPTTAYRQQVAQAEAGVADGTSAAQRDAIVELQSSTAYTRDVLTTIGGKELESKGTTDASAQDQLDEGLTLVNQWFADHDVDLNPKYSIDLAGITDTSKADPAVGETSVAVSALAKAGLAAQPSATYTAELPANLVCGG